jgi:hypothetical protein
MTNWTEFVKKFAKDNNTTYGCALSNPDCSAEYRQKYGVKKPLGKNKEKQLMGTEDVNVASSRPPKKTPERKQQLSAVKQKLNKKNTQKQLIETMGMMKEDINSRGLRPPTTPLVQDIAGNFIEPPVKRKGGRKKGSKNFLHVILV